MKYSNYLKTSAHTPHRSIETFQSQNYLKNVQRLQIVLRALFITKNQSYQAEFFSKLHFKDININKSNKQQSNKLSQQQMLAQFLNHCATKIQAKFKAYKQRKYYLKFLPIYRRLRQILLAAALGWKTRRILNLQQNQKTITHIKKLQSTQQQVRARIEKRQFLNTFFKQYKSGKWTEIAKKQALNNQKNKTIRIKNLLIPENTNQPVFKPATKKSTKNIQPSISLNQTKKITKRNNTPKQSQIVKTIGKEYKHQFDDIPIKGNSKGVYNIQEPNQAISKVTQKPIRQKNTPKNQIKKKQKQPQNLAQKEQKKDIKQSIITEQIIYKTGQLEKQKNTIKQTKRQKLTLISKKINVIPVEERSQVKKNEQFTFCRYGEIDDKQVILYKHEQKQIGQQRFSNNLVEMYETRYKSKKQILNSKIKDLNEQKTSMLSNFKLKYLQ